jgi:hypothetical protein
MLEQYHVLMGRKAYLDQQVSIIKDEAAEQIEEFSNQFKENGKTLEQQIEEERQRLFEILGGRAGEKASDEYGMLEIQTRTSIDYGDEASVLTWLKEQGLYNYIKEEIRKQTFNTYFRTLSEEFRPEGVKLVEKPTLVVTLTKEVKPVWTY